MCSYSAMLEMACEDLVLIFIKGGDIWKTSDIIELQINSLIYQRENAARVDFFNKTSGLSFRKK